MFCFFYILWQFFFSCLFNASCAQYGLIEVNMKKTDRPFTFKEFSSREKRNNKQIITNALKLPSIISVLEKYHKNKEIFWDIIYFSF